MIPLEPSKQYIEVVVPLSLPFATLTYLTDERVSVGTRVLVSIGSSGKEIVALVWSVGIEGEDLKFKSDKVKQIVEVLDSTPLIGEREIRFVEWFSNYYMVSLSETLRTLAPQIFSKEMSGQSSRWSRAKLLRERKSLAKQLKENPNSGDQPPIAPKRFDRVFTDFDLLNSRPITLLHTKKEVDIVSIINTYLSQCEDNKHSTLLLIVPTGEECEKMARVLEGKFSVAVASSKVSTKRRARLSLDMAVGIVPEVVVGTRSALLLHYESLSAVVVMDEHSFHYRSMRAPIFSVRDAAMMLANLHGAKTLLLSPYPSVESYYNAKSQGGWGYLNDLSEKGDSLDYIVLERGREMISKYAVKEIQKALDSGKRAVIMQNRRGVASYVECDICSHVPQCPNCSTSLTLHQHLLGCHYCGYSKQIELRCERCGGVMRRRGRGTQQLEKQLEELFVGAAVVRYDADSMADIKGRQTDDMKWDIAVGTLLVVDAVDWSEVAVAVIANVDNILSTPNFRASEDAYRVVGRMGLLSSRVGAKLIVQSSRLDYDAVNQALRGEDFEFYSHEIAERRVGMFPPHSRMLKVEFKAKEISSIMPLAHEVERLLRQVFGERLSPLHQPMVERQRGEYIVDLLLKILRVDSSVEAKRLLVRVLGSVRGEAKRLGVQISVEVD